MLVRRETRSDSAGGSKNSDDNVRFAALARLYGRSRAHVGENGVSRTPATTINVVHVGFVWRDDGQPRGVDGGGSDKIASQECSSPKGYRNGPGSS